MNSSSLLAVLQSERAEDVERWCKISAGREGELFSLVVPLALSGNRAAAHSYVSAWKQLTSSLLHSLHDSQPDLIVEDHGHLVALDMKAWPAPASVLLLEAEALEAPFSSWVVRTNDVGVGTCAALIQKLREVLPGFRPVALDQHGLPHWQHTESQLRAFRRYVSEALNAGDPPLERIRQVFALSLTQLGELFGVTRQAVSQWLEKGVPEEREAKVSTVASIADLLERQLKTDRIPGIVRREADAYGGRNALQMIKEDRHLELLDITRTSFDWAVPA
jgi:hypothetical protein